MPDLDNAAWFHRLADDFGRRKKLKAVIVQDGPSAFKAQYGRRRTASRSTSFSSTSLPSVRRSWTVTCRTARSSWSSAPASRSNSLPSTTSRVHALRVSTSARGSSSAAKASRWWADRNGIGLATRLRGKTVTRSVRGRNRGSAWT
jgi:hypothetical protein